MTAKADRKFGAVAAATLAGIVALVALSLHTVWQLRGEVAEFDRARDMHVLMQRIAATLLDLESSQHRYLLTQEAPDLEPFRAGLVRLDAALAKLPGVTLAQPDLAADLQRLHELVDAKRAEMAGTVTLVDSQGMGAARTSLRNAHGEALMDDIRQVMSRLDGLEGASRSQRQVQRTETIDRKEHLTGLLSAALALLMVALYVLVRRDRALKAQAVRNETSARDLLAQRVNEKTRELQATAHSLALSEGRLRGIFDSATDGILTTDAAQIIVEANPAAARMFRCAVSDLVGAPLERLIPARHREAHKHLVRAFATGSESARRMSGTDHSRVVSALRFDGEEFPIEASISHAEVGGQRLFTVVHRDITERLQTQHALWDSKSRLEAALASMTDAVFISDADGRLVEFNDAFVSFHRFHSRKACPLTVAEYPKLFDVSLADGTPVPLEQWAMTRALRGEAASSVEYRLRRKDTGETWVGSYSFAPIRAGDGSIVGAVVNGRDFSDIKQAQADLAASHTALRSLVANQLHVQEDERKRIARELHDDLQQSLAAIRMDAIAIGERLAKGRNDIEPLLARIDSLSGAAIVSTRRIVSDLRPEMLEELGLVAALEAMCTQHAERTGSDCELEVSSAAIGAQLDTSVVSTGLYRIAQEALNNVAKHAQASIVRVRLDCLHDGLVVLRVGDNGTGMRARDKLDPSSFGLRGMAERVRALGGQLGIESEPGKGTTIEALVPLLVTDPTQDSAAAAAARVMVATHDEGPLAPGSRNTWGHPLQTVIDALADNVAVLDRQGVVQLVNKAWRAFAAQHGDPGLQSCGPGVSYLQVCQRSASSEPSAHAVLLGLRAVLDGSHTAYMTEYPCDLPEGQRWFRMHAAALTGGMAIVTHIDISGHPGQSASGERENLDLRH